MTGTSQNFRLQAIILKLLDERKPGATICPSDAARAASSTNWRALMQPAREAAAQLAEKGKIIATQHGKAVDPLKARGPIRLRKA